MESNILSNKDADCEKLNKEIITKSLNSRDDIGGMLINMSSTIHFKKIILIWLIYLLMNTELFLENILSKFSNTSNENSLTMKGTFICSLFLVLCIILIDFIYII
jgi:hypothetical protein